MQEFFAPLKPAYFTVPTVRTAVRGYDDPAKPFESKAIAAANAQIAKSPNDANFYDLLGTALRDYKEDYPGAEAALRKAVEIDNNNVDTLEKLVELQDQEGASDKALALCLQGIKDHPREVSLYILCGELYEAKKDQDQAKGMYQQALSISPDDPVASNNLSYMIPAYTPLAEAMLASLPATGLRFSQGYGTRRLLRHIKIPHDSNVSNATKLEAAQQISRCPRTLGKDVSSYNGLAIVHSLASPCNLMYLQPCPRTD